MSPKVQKIIIIILVIGMLAGLIVPIISLLV